MLIKTTMSLFRYLLIPFCITIIFISSETFAKKAAIVLDFDTKEVLFEVNANTKNYPASLTKIMTLYILFDQLEKGKITNQTNLKVSKIAASRSPSKLYLEEGSSIKVKDAVMALIVKSALGVWSCLYKILNEGTAITINIKHGISVHKTSTATL